MKHKLLILAVVSALGLSAAGVVYYTIPIVMESRAVEATTEQHTATFTVENMTCAMCPITVRKAMGSVKGVKSVQVDFDTHSATVVYDPAVTAVKRIAKASTDAGYPAQLSD